MSIKNILVISAAAFTLTGIAAFTSSDAGMCGIVRDDGSICQRLSGGKADCDGLGGKWDSKKNCCEINNVGG